MTREVHRLSWRQFALIYAVAVSVFIAVNGPVWRHPFDLDRSIIWSYLPIPVLVAGCLLFVRRFGGLSFLLNTAEAVLVKFGVTYLGATILWMASGGPPPEARTAAVETAAGHVAPAPPPRGTPLRVESSSDGFRPAKLVVAVGQALVVHSADGRLHTFRVFDPDGVIVSNQAIPPGAPTTLTMREPFAGTVGCAVHPREPRAELEVHAAPPVQ